MKATENKKVLCILRMRKWAIYSGHSAAISRIRESCASMIDSTPERFAIEHHLMLTETKDKDESIAIARGRAMYSNRANNASLFSVNLGKHQAG